MTIVERMLDSIRDFTVRYQRSPTYIYLGYLEMHEYRTDPIYSYYNKPTDEDITFHDYYIIEVKLQDHLNVA